MDFQNMQKHLNQMMNKQNNRSIPEFEGYSPAEMHQILHFTFGKESPLKLKKLSDSDYKKIPMLNQIKYLTDLIDRKGELRLTRRGYLPTKTVSELYEQKFLKDKFIEEGIQKLYKETDSMTINLTRILTELSKLVKKRNGKLSLTKSSRKILADDYKLLRLIFSTFATKFNWAYYDRYPGMKTGQLGYGFSLILLSKYGHKKRLDSFYAEKYLNAYPRLLDAVEPDNVENLKDQMNRCYSLRTFDRFLKYFGLINIYKK
ncbi:MAG: hypothetical protein R6W70_10505, partial [bacterium]